MIHPEAVRIGLDPDNDDAYVSVDPPLEDGRIYVGGRDADGCEFGFHLTGKQSKQLARALWRAGGIGYRREKQKETP